MVQYVLHAEIRIKGFYKIFKYKIFELFKYIDMTEDRFETCIRHQKLKIKVLIQKRCISLVYIV